MASDLGEEMDTETEISGDSRNLLPREGSVNVYGFHLGEMKANRTKMMARHVVKLVKLKWCVLRIFFKLSSKMFFVLCNSNTGHWPIAFICMQSCSRKTTCSRKKTARSEGCPCRYADINARHVLVTVVNKIGRPNTTRTVRGICRFAVYFLVFRPFCRFTLVYEGHFVLCYEEKSYSR